MLIIDIPTVGGLMTLIGILFLNHLNIWLTLDLPNAANKIRIFLACLKKRHLKTVADFINDHLTNEDIDFDFLT